MGNNSSHKRTKVPKRAVKERPPDMNKAREKQQFFSHLKQRPSTKIVLLFPVDKRQQRAEVAAGARGGSPAATPMMRGAGDGAERHEDARAREMKILVLLLLLDSRLQEEGRRAAGGAGAGGGAKAAQAWQRLYRRLVAESETHREADLAEEQPRKRCR
ncbi:bcl-2-like protein from testis [Rhinolophus ferrumequinum]|uniref:Bcl-2-like protein from testis n=2 Tax=Rhinolophus ferrumequinum TaxID=59479 RepID=A0A7J7S768_RHIFE|nr:bcl-2-like protein from testis [Rhinolophus ferrumequinum]